jgi:hypothetical protein
MSPKTILPQNHNRLTHINRHKQPTHWQCHYLKLFFHKTIQGSYINRHKQTNTLALSLPKTCTKPQKAHTSIDTGNQHTDNVITFMLRCHPNECTKITQNAQNSNWKVLTLYLHKTFPHLRWHSPDLLEIALHTSATVHYYKINCNHHPINWKLKNGKNDAACTNGAQQSHWLIKRTLE